MAIPEALEISKSMTDQLPRGKEADGIIGDFVLRNDKIEAVISGNLPLRRANMSTFYGADGITPGCLYDLTQRRSDNDQITIFCPAGQQGPVSWVRIVDSSSDPSTSQKQAAVECMVTAAVGGGISRRHVYSLQDGWQGVQITSTLRNETDKPIKTSPLDRWTNFLKTGVAPGGILWADSVDPADRCGYAVGPTHDPAEAHKKASLELAPGESITFTRFLAVGTSPANAVSEVCKQQGLHSRLKGQITDKAGTPVSDAAVWFRPKFAVTAPPVFAAKASSNQPDNNGRLTGIDYVDKEGAFELTLPKGLYTVTIIAPGRPDSVQEMESTDSAPTLKLVELDNPSGIAFDIKDEKGVSIPCKAQFLALPGTEPVNLGPDQRAHGCRDQYHNESGRFYVGLQPGRYQVVVTRGIEYSHLEQEIEVAPGKTSTISGILKRLVDTQGWVSADYHNHSTPSGDNVCGTKDRLINLAAEHIEFAPTTEHNRIYDWRPEIDRLGLSDYLQTVVGLESTGSKAHFNAFPFQPVPFTQDNGAPVWNADPRINALTLREWQKPTPDRWVQINHPDLFENFYENRGTGDKEGGFAGLIQLINGYEVQNGPGTFLLDKAPFRLSRNSSGTETVIWNREFLWLHMLNQGRRTNAVAVCDAHSVYGNGVGSWRMYMPSSSDEPSKIDWRENLRAARDGHSYLTTGPFLQVTTTNGAGPGDTVSAGGKPLVLKIRVQCTDWIDIDRVQVLVNGRQSPNLNFTKLTNPDFFKEGVVKFERSVEVPVTVDSHIIVVACAENSTLKTGYGTSSQSTMRPFAYHNPIWVDVDGNGTITPNNDSLEYPVPDKPVGVSEAKTYFERKK